MVPWECGPHSGGERRTQSSRLSSVDAHQIHRLADAQPLVMRIQPSPYLPNVVFCGSGMHRKEKVDGSIP
jgi:hypothetical protein